MSGASQPVRPGEFGDGDRAELVNLVAVARRSHEWSALAERLVRLRAWGVPVAALSVVVGVGESRLRRVCRDHGPGPATVGDPLGEAGWVDTAVAARAVLGVSAARLLEHTARAEGDGVAVMVGWIRRWHGPSLPGWWAAQRVESRSVARVRRDGRADRVRVLVGRRCDGRGGGRRGRGDPVERLPLSTGRASTRTDPGGGVPVAVPWGLGRATAPGCLRASSAATPALRVSGVAGQLAVVEAIGGSSRLAGRCPVTTSPARSLSHRS